MMLVGFVIAGLATLWLLRRKFGRATLTIAAFVAALPALFLAAGPSSAATSPVLLATSGNYSVLAGSTVTNTGATTLDGSLGVSPGTAVTGFPPGIVTAPAVIDAGNAAAAQAQSDLTVAYNDAAGRPLTSTTAADLVGLDLGPGVYAGPSKGALALGGTLTLDGGGDPSSVFIFQTDSSLTTATSSSVVLTNGAQECNVFWQVGSSATLGTNSDFAGNILAQTSVTVTTGVTVHGRALARTGAVTLDTDTFSAPTCDQTVPTTTAGGSTTTASGGSTTTTGGPTTTTGGPTTTTGGPTTTTGGPTTTTGGSTTTASGGSTTTTSGPTTTTGGPTTTAGGPTTTGASTTTTLAVGSNTTIAGASTTTSPAFVASTTGGGSSTTRAQAVAASTNPTSGASGTELPRTGSNLLAPLLLGLLALGFGIAAIWSGRSERPSS